MIARNLDTFKDILGTLQPGEHMIDFCRLAYLHGTPHVFSGREADYYSFRKKIAEHFRISYHEVFIVGSAKLGYNPRKGTEFSYDSDIDVAIVSVALFEEFMLDIMDYQMQMQANRVAVTYQELKAYHKFLEYIAIGWMRPDKLPISFNIGLRREKWFEFFRSLSHGKSSVGNYKVTAGVFKSYNHLEAYTLSGIVSLKNEFQVQQEVSNAAQA